MKIVNRIIKEAQKYYFFSENTQNLSISRNEKIESSICSKRYKSKKINVL